MTSQPRIFHLITRLIDGGATNALLDIVTQLNDVNATVGHGAAYDADIAKRLSKRGIPRRRFPLLRHYNLATAGPAVLTVAAYLRQHDFDIIHTHSTEAGIIGRFAASLAGVPNVVHTIHGVPFTSDRNPLLNRFLLACERMAASRTDVMVSIAERIAEEYVDKGIGNVNQYQVIRYGIDLDRFRSASPASDLPEADVRVLMAGRLVEGKGFDVLFQALDNLGNREDVRVLVAGEGPLLNELEERAKTLGISPLVDFLGYRNDIERVMAGSDILVLPSYREGTPFVIQEAMASGLPVVATNIAGIPEQVAEGKTGFLVPPGDVEEFRRALVRLVEDDGLRNTLGLNAREEADQYSVDRMVSEYGSLYRELGG